MTLGINVTSNDPVNGWESLKPSPISKAEAAYRTQRDIANEMERRHNEFIDSWIACKNYDAMEQSTVECNKASELAYELYKQIYCKHNNAHFGETCCPDCNKRLED